MSNRTNIDAELARWGERVFNSGRVERIKPKRGLTGMRLSGPQGGASGARKGGGGGANMVTQAADTRRRVHAIFRKTPQVLVRISGGGKSIGHIKAHLDYISRDGQIPLEDQHGDKFEGKDDIGALRDEWHFGGFPMDAGKARQAFNIILSMPAGTDEQAVLRAARDFARDEFGQYQYAMALHTAATDPDSDPSPNPHVHLCVKAMALDGTRLNPRKADLKRWREGFAHCLRAHGVDADASRRIHRLQRVRAEKQGVRHKKERGERFEHLGTRPVSPQRIERAKLVESQMVANLAQLTTLLAKSDNPSDQRLAMEVAQRMQEHARKRAPAPGYDRA